MKDTYPGPEEGERKKKRGKEEHPHNTHTHNEPNRANSEKGREEKPEPDSQKGTQQTSGRGGGEQKRLTNLNSETCTKPRRRPKEPETHRGTHEKKETHWG